MTSFGLHLTPLVCEGRLKGSVKYASFSFSAILRYIFVGDRYTTVEGDRPFLSFYACRTLMKGEKKVYARSFVISFFHTHSPTHQ